MIKSKKIIVSLACMAILSVTLRAAWTTKRLTSNAGSSYYPAIAVDGANVYVAWYDYTPGNAEIYFKRSSDGGSTWQASKRITFNSGYSEYPDIAVNGSTLYIVYADDTAGNSDIFFRKSSDNGSTWQAAKRITNNMGTSNAPKIAISGANVCVVWWDDTPGNSEIYFRKSTDGGTTWQSAKRLTNHSGTSYVPDIVGYGSYLYVVWYDCYSGSNEIYFRRSIDGGSTWQNEKRLTSNAGSSECAANAVGGLLGANLYVTWQDYTPGNFDIYFIRSLDRGATWQTAMKLTNNSGASMFPSIAVSGSNIYVAWQDDTPGNEEIYMRKSADSGATWQATQRITHNMGRSEYPAVALSVSNQYMTYDDNNSGNCEIYLKFSPL